MRRCGSAPTIRNFMFGSRYEARRSTSSGTMRRPLRRPRRAADCGGFTPPFAYWRRATRKSASFCPREPLWTNSWRPSDRRGRSPRGSGGSNVPPIASITPRGCAKRGCRKPELIFGFDGAAVDVDKAPARFFEYAGRAEFEFWIVAPDPEERGAGFERGFEILAVWRRGVIIEKFLEGRAAEPGADQGSYRHGDRPARDQDNAGDRQRGDVFELVRKPGGDKFARLPLGGGERLVRGQDRQILVPAAGGEEGRP